ncbi:MAG: hypothetical protein HZA50_01715 [Planctomycetes bacterium]|nr:hypothetical protein [Planctomycetota bacterium]
MKKHIQKTIQELIALLVARRYRDVESLTNATRLTANEIQGIISDYGRILVDPPDSAWQFMEIIEVKNSSPCKWSIVMPLWTQEEGRSDLSLEVTVIHGEKELVVELDDIHVL